jgi:hypothetical protein
MLGMVGFYWLRRAEIGQKQSLMKLAKLEKSQSPIELANHHRGSSKHFSKVRKFAVDS